MKRLTTRTINGDGCPIQILTNQTYHNLCDRLADIEDILGDNYDLDHLQELVDGDRDNRCVMFQKGYPVVSQFYIDEDGLYIREATGVVSRDEYEQCSIYWKCVAGFSDAVKKVGAARARKKIKSTSNGRCVIRPRTVWKIGPLWRPVEVKYRFWMRPLMGRWFFLTREDVLQHI